MAGRQDRNEEGFTLVEVVVVVSMLALISTVVAAAIIVVFRSEAGVVRLAAESHDTQQGTNFFPLDVQAGPLEQAAYNISAGATGCSVTAPAGTTNVLQFEKGDKRVAYRLTVNGDRGRLDRQICDFPGFGNLIQVNIADQLDGFAALPATAQLLPTGGTLVESVELRLVQNNTDAVLIASPRAEPRNSPGDCQTDNPLEAAHGFGTYVETDVELYNGEITGWLALGGTLSWMNDLRVATQNMSGVAPEYGLYAEHINWAAIARSNTLSLSDLDVVSNTATATSDAHGYLVGDTVIIDNTTDTAIDGNAFTVTSVTANTFSFSVTTGDADNLIGTSRLVQPLDNLDIIAGVGTATVVGHGYSVGQQIAVEGTGDSDVDGDAYVVATVVDSDNFTFSATAPGALGLAGFVRAVNPVVLDVAKETAAIGGPAPAFHQAGDLVYEVAGSLDNYIDLSGPSNPSAEPTADQLDFPLDFDELRDCSAQLAQLLDICELDGCANEVDVTVDNTTGVINACSSDPIPQLLNVPERFFDGTWTFDTSGPGCQGFSQTRPLLLNVIDDGDGVVTFETAAGDWTALGDRKNIAFNFPNSTSVVIKGGFWGHILAPFAHVTTNGSVEGGIIARSWTHIDGLIQTDDDIFDNEIDWP